MRSLVALRVLLPAVAYGASTLRYGRTREFASAALLGGPSDDSTHLSLRNHRTMHPTDNDHAQELDRGAVLSAALSEDEQIQKITGMAEAAAASVLHGRHNGRRKPNRRREGGIFRRETKGDIFENLVAGSIQHRDILENTCRVCMMAGPHAPMLFIQPKNDGMGATWQSIVAGMGVAHYCGMNFGGMVRGEHEAHGMNVAEVANYIFGVNDKAMIFTEGYPQLDETFNSIKDMGCPRPHCSGSGCTKQYLLDTNAPQLEAGNIDSNRANGEKKVMTPEFVDALRDQIKHRASAIMMQRGSFQTGVPTVALHIRRGEVSKNTMVSRYTPNSWYQGIIERIREHLPMADVHVFSSIHDEHAGMQFAGFKARNCTLHLKGEGEEIETWAHLMSADIFIAAKSSFSWLPAVLNEGCVIYQELPLALSNWNMLGPQGVREKNFDDLLQSCLTQAWTKSKKDVADLKRAVSLRHSSEALGESGPGY